MKTFKVFLEANYTEMKVRKVDIVEAESMKEALDEAEEIYLKLDHRGNYNVVDIVEV